MGEVNLRCKLRHRSCPNKGDNIRKAQSTRPQNHASTQTFEKLAIVSDKNHAECLDKHGLQRCIRNFATTNMLRHPSFQQEVLS